MNGNALSPFAPKLVQAGGPHLAAHDFSLTTQTRWLWTEFMGSRRSWVWPDPDSAPFVETNTVNSYVRMSIGNATASCELQLPWHFQKGVDRVQLQAMFVGNDAGIRVQSQFYLDDFDSAVTAEKASVGSDLVFAEATPPGLWARRNDQWRVAYVFHNIHGVTTDNMTAERHGTIRVGINFNYRVDPGGPAITRRVKLYALSAVDQFPHPTPPDEA